MCAHLCTLDCSVHWGRLPVRVPGPTANLQCDLRCISSPLDLSSGICKWIAQAALWASITECAHVVGCAGYGAVLLCQQKRGYMGAFERAAPLCLSQL